MPSVAPNRARPPKARPQQDPASKQDANALLLDTLRQQYEKYVDILFPCP